MAFSIKLLSPPFKPIPTPAPVRGAPVDVRGCKDLKELGGPSGFLFGVSLKSWWHLSATLGTSLICFSVQEPAVAPMVRQGDRKGRSREMEFIALTHFCVLFSIFDTFCKSSFLNI